MLMKKCEPLPPVTCAVAYPCDRDSLLGPIEAAKLGLIDPVLVGPEDKIRAVAKAEGVDLAPYRIVPTEHSHASAEKAVALVRAGEVEALMKGSLHTDELMSAVVSSATGLRTSRRISHVFIMDVPTHPHALAITDAAINIAPTLEDKMHIAQNAIDLAHALGVAEPKVAILSAVETINPKIPSTLDAAALCKMADRGQITGAILDGPLAFDNAISEAGRPHQEDHLARRRQGGHSPGARPGGGQHARQTIAVSRRGRCRRDCPWRARADCPDQPCRQRPHPAGLHCRHETGRPRQTRGEPNPLAEL